MRQFFPFLLEMRFGRLDLVARVGDDKDEWWGRDISIYEWAAVTGGSLFFYLSVSFSFCASGLCSSSDKEITSPLLRHIHVVCAPEVACSRPFPLEQILLTAIAPNRKVLKYMIKGWITKVPERTRCVILIPPPWVDPSLDFIPGPGYFEIGSI